MTFSFQIPYKHGGSTSKEFGFMFLLLNMDATILLKCHLIVYRHTNFSVLLIGLDYSPFFELLPDYSTAMLQNVE